jgi:3-hydroxy acid dehydrogenase/malonic semialdehyde reductase
MNKNRFVLITGATSGFGKATAKLFAQNNWNLVITGRREDRLSEIKKDFESNYSVTIYTLCFDVRDQLETQREILSLPKDVLNSIEILINNAGLAAGRDSIQNGSLEDWEQMIDTNIKGLLYVTKSILPFFIQNNSGHILNISSIAGKENYPNGNVYCATKHAVDSLSSSMRMDLIEHNIKVTNIAPGAAETEFSFVRFKGDISKSKETYQGYTPLSAEDVAEVIYFAANRPKHVCLNDITIMPTAQASASIFTKK